MTAARSAKLSHDTQINAADDKYAKVTQISSAWMIWIDSLRAQNHEISQQNITNL